MAFPTIPTVASGRVLTAVQADQTATRTFPNLSGLTKNSGDLLIAIVIGYTGGSLNSAWSGWTAGWTEFADRLTTAGSTMAVGAAYKWSTGSETGTISVTQSGVNGQAAMILLSIPGAHATSPPEGGSAANGTASLANIPSFNPTGWDVEDTLWIAVGGNGEVSTSGSFTGITAGPTDYTDLVVTGISADVVGGVDGAVAFRQNATAVEDPTNFTADISNARNIGMVLAVRPAPSVTNYNLTGTVTGTAEATASANVSSSVSGTVTGTAAATATIDVSTGGGGGAFAVTARHTGNNALVPGSTVTTASATPTANSMLLTFFTTENNNSVTAPTLSVPTGGGYSYSLIQKIGDTTAFPWGGGASEYRLASAAHRADVGASPSAHTVTEGGGLSAYAALATVDVTGHNTSAPIVQSKASGAGITQTDSGQGTVTLDSTPSAGSLLIVSFGAGADAGGGFASPTAGAGKTFTQSHNQSTAYCQLGVWYRVCDGTESATITCSDLGQSVGNWTAIAVEIAPAGGGGALNVTGTVTGTAAATGTLLVAKTVGGTVTGTASATASVVVGKAASGTVTGTAAATGTLTAAKPVTGTVTGTGSASGTAVVARPVTAAVTGTGAATGTLARAIPLGGTVTGTAAAAAQIVVGKVVTGTVIGATSATGSITVTGAGLSGTVTGTAAAAASATVARSTAGTVTGTGAASGSLTVGKSVTGAVSGTGSATGAAVVARPLGGTVTGTAAATASIVVGRTVTGAVTGAAAASATINVATVGAVTGTVTGTAAAASTAVVARSVTASVTGTGAAAASVAVGKTVTGTVQGTAAATAAAARGVVAEGTVEGTAAALAEATVAAPTAGTVTGTASAEAEIVVSVALTINGTVVGTSAATATLILGDPGVPAIRPRVSVTSPEYSVQVQPYAGSVHVESNEGTVTVEAT